jgi:hypothetical protein
VDPYYKAPVGGKTTDEDNSTGPELKALSNPNTRAEIIAKQNNEIFIIKNNEKVLIEVISKFENDAALTSYLTETLEMTNQNGDPETTIDNGPHTFVQSGYLTFAKLDELIDDLKNDAAVKDMIKYIRPLYPPIFSQEGNVGTQGDSTMKSFVARERFGPGGPLIDGTGIKIGVISG